MNLRTILIIIHILIPTFISAQLKHCISYNSPLYIHFFNKQKDIIKLKSSFSTPNVSYLLSGNKIGIEVAYLSRFGMNYYPDWERNLVPENSILQINSTNTLVSIHYAILNKKKFQVRLNSGFIRNWYENRILIHWQFHGSFDIQRESSYGSVSGINCSLQLYKNIYTNTNLRYSYFPTAEYNKQNLMWEIGIGYMLQRKVER